MSPSPEFENITSLREQAVVLAGNFIAGLRLIVRNHISSVDMNPHEGRLRGSVIESRFIKAPDYPPDSEDKSQ